MPSRATARSHSLRSCRSPWQASLNIAHPVLSRPTTRFASTSQQPSGPSTATSPPNNGDPIPGTDIAPAIENDFISTELEGVTSQLSSIPEHLGYLKDLGLDYGWGPTAFVEWLLEHVHILSGTPWWASIILTALAVRLALLKPFIEAADTSARIATLQPLIKPIQARLNQAKQNQDQAATLFGAQELQNLYRNAGIKLWKIAVPLVQAPIGYGTFRLLRGMSELPVPGLEEGGFLWIQDLTVADPFYVLPALTAVAIHWTFKASTQIN